MNVTKCNVFRRGLEIKEILMYEAKPSAAVSLHMQASLCGWWFALRNESVKGHPAEHHAGNEILSERGRKGGRELGEVVENDE